MNGLGRPLIVLGLILVAAGLVISFAPRLPTWLGRLPVPLPDNYVLGLDLQRRDFESFGHDYYLGGTWSKTGWWYYYLYALAIKVPLGTWLLLPLALVARSRVGHSASRLDELALLAPTLLILAFVSSQTGLNEHMRYVLPVFPFCFILLGGAARHLRPWGGPSRLTASRALAGALVVSSLAWSVGVSLRYHPHGLSYFNELAGGPGDGWKHLIGSNVDWGQDLLFLKKWTDDHPEARPLKLALYGTIDPRHVGIAGEVFSWDSGESGLAQGYYAVSSTIRSGFGRPRDSKASKELDQIQEYEVIGSSIIVFEKGRTHPPPRPR